jgi:acetyl esterase/lipase
MAVAGESVGGNMTAAVALMAKDAVMSPSCSSRLTPER